jgi:hypothetical protein
MIDIPIVMTDFLIEEIKTSGHAPLRFRCDDNNTYYCKYLNDFNAEEINFLAYEMVSHYLLRALDIPTPDIALVQIREGTLNKRKITKNRRLRVNHICFGSKAIVPASIITEFRTCDSKIEYNKISNPQDIVKIALFDLWINNVDRGRFTDPGFNYNLLSVQQKNKEIIMAIDHSFVFGGINQLGIFKPTMPFAPYDKLHHSGYFKSCMAYMDDIEFSNIVDNFIPLLKTSYKDIIDDVILQVGEIWNLTPNLADKINDFLSSPYRIEQVEKAIYR